METNFYSRATGKLKQTSSNSFTDVKRSKQDGSTIYSIEDDEEDSLQYPMGELSRTQLKFIQSFVRSITSDPSIEIDPITRGIHWIGSWSSPFDQVTVTCYITQPVVINGIIHLSGVSYDTVLRHSHIHFTSQDKGAPTVMKTNTSCQILGKYAIPLADSLIEHGIIKDTNVRWSNVVIGQTHPIFIIVTDKCIYECSMTYGSCLVIDRCKPDSVNISHPVTGKLNWSFRSSRLTQGRGSGPHVTVHGSGIFQYQGSASNIEEVITCFKECIDTVMLPNNASRFIKSLNLIRKI